MDRAVLVVDVSGVWTEVHMLLMSVYVVWAELYWLLMSQCSMDRAVLVVDVTMFYGQRCTFC